MSTPADYHEIKRQLRKVIQEDSRTQSAKVFIEPAKVHSPEQTPTVSIFTLSRSAPVDKEPISSGREFVYEVRMLLIVAHHSGEGREAACELRDDFMKELELVLMENRKLGGTTETLRLEGGEMGAEKRGPVFWSEATLEITADVRVTL